MDLGASQFQHLADSLRVWAPSIAAGGHSQEEVARTIEWCQLLSDAFAVRSIRLGTFTFSVEQLVRAVATSALLKNAGHLHTAVQLTLSLVLPRPIAEHLCQGMGSMAVVPKRSFLYEHRLTLHLGWCLMARKRNSVCLSDSASIVRFATVDASLIGGRDWVWQAATTLGANALFETFAAAMELISGASPQADELIDRLNERLQLRLCSPTCVGSGRSNKVAKMHCIVHACRMECESWDDTVRLVN